MFHLAPLPIALFLIFPFTFVRLKLSLRAEFLVKQKMSSVLVCFKQLPRDLYGLLVWF